MKMLACLAVSLVGCAGSARQPLDWEASKDLLSKAERLQNERAFAEAQDLYLQCLERCPVVARPIAAEQLRNLARLSPETDAATWSVARTVEARLLDAKAPSDELSGDLAALQAVYRFWEQPSLALDLLSRIRKAAPQPTYDAALKEFASYFPDAFRQMSDRDVEFLVGEVARAPARDRQALASSDLRPSDIRLFEEVRVSTAVGYAASLVVSRHPEAARRLLRHAMNGIESAACDKILAEVVERKSVELTSVACMECASIPECKGTGEPAVKDPPLEALPAGSPPQPE